MHSVAATLHQIFIEKAKRYSYIVQKSTKPDKNIADIFYNPSSTPDDISKAGFLCPEEIEYLLQNIEISDTSDDGDDGWPTIVNEEDINTSESSSEEDDYKIESISNTTVIEEINGN
ncbi:hypothetical protein AVEN_271354-1 [Araneus ventricosus]|uniref:Uncharacterized protein n=1 Tax=Araneus ventricosus TaxID=182803 RepID=A0A4Y2R6H5_ARAVE|nr:hypothetical protein AVEN_271168-1 [Araneus ventricosus]GBN71092.1 hypothetical protein AVEN_271354-1 [Araneus ventricosus]